LSLNMGDIEVRLRNHAQAFDGLLSLIPAKYYYGEDTSDQWQKKKQTKEEQRNAKRAKLDPDAAKSAKDIMDENARKRKRESDGPLDDQSLDDPKEELGSEAPKEGLKRGDMSTKRQKKIQESRIGNELNSSKSSEVEERRRLKAEKQTRKKAAQRERKKEKTTAMKEKPSLVEQKEAVFTANADSDSSSTHQIKKLTKETSSQVQKETTNDDGLEQEGYAIDEDIASIQGFTSNADHQQAENASFISSTPVSPVFDIPNNHSGTSSISSIVPPSEPTDTTLKPSQKPKASKANIDEFKQRFQKRLEELRAARHADGLNGQPARNRQELIEARRQKAEQRKAHKKELRRKAKEAEEKRKDEEMALRFSPGGSGSLLGSPRSPVDSTISASNNFSFGRIAFADGQRADPSLSRILEQPKRPGPQDPATALKAAEAKKARLADLGPEKRADIEEKDMWLNAKKRVHGERIRDDTSLLKKALKRKESAKRKSEREWKERIDGISKGKDIRQKQREENIRKRKEAKTGGNKKGGGSKAKSKGKARPGFEGSFKAKVGGKKK